MSKEVKNSVYLESQKEFWLLPDPGRDGNNGKQWVSAEVTSQKKLGESRVVLGGFSVCSAPPLKLDTEHNVRCYGSVKAKTPLMKVLMVSSVTLYQ